MAHTPDIKLRPSDAHRWLVCRASPGYIAANQDKIPDVVEEYTKEGENAHTLAEALLTGDTTTADQYSGDLEMVDHVEGYVSYCRQSPKKGTNYDTFVEQLVKVYYSPKNKGYIDCIVIEPERNRIHIIDLKYGRGKGISAYKNPQLAIYARSFIDEMDDVYGFRPTTEVWITIYQPRKPDEEGQVSKTWYTTKEELYQYTDEIGATAKAIKADPYKQAFVPGEGQCDFCPLAATCQARASWLLNGVDEVIAAPEPTALTLVEPTSPVPQLPEPNTLSPKQIARLMDVAPTITTWLNKIQKYASETALQLGTQYPGYKIVESSKHRRWLDEQAAAAALRKCFPHSVVYSESVISPTKALELLKKKKLRRATRKVIEALIIKPTGDAVLVPESDKRPVLIDCDAKAEFDDVSSFDGDELL